VGGSAFLLTRWWGGLAETGDTPSAGFLLQHFGLYGGIAALGLFLMFIAIRGAIARIRAGLPSDDEGVGANPMSRALNVVIYGAGFLFGAVTLAINIVPGSQVALLVAQGVTVEAKILGFDKADEEGVWIARYEFQTKSGQIVRDTVRTEPSKTTPSTDWLKTLDVVYLESDPSQHKPLLGYSHSGFVFFLVTRLAIALVGLWGLMKNLAPMPKVEDFDAPSPASEQRLATASAGSLPASRVVAGMPRKSFGRRGV
jgi:hypothetical protein